MDVKEEFLYVNSCFNGIFSFNDYSKMSEEMRAYLKYMADTYTSNERYHRFLEKSIEQTEHYKRQAAQMIPVQQYLMPQNDNVILEIRSIRCSCGLSSDFRFPRFEEVKPEQLYERCTRCNTTLDLGTLQIIKCRKCGLIDDIRIRRYQKEGSDDKKDRLYYVVCTKCGIDTSYGTYQDTPAGARIEWNKQNKIIIDKSEYLKLRKIIFETVDEKLKEYFGIPEE